MASRQRRDPFRNLFYIASLVGLVAVAGVVTYGTALMAFRFQDQLLDPWSTWVFWRFAISTTWIVPTAITFILWLNYDTPLWYTIQKLFCVAYIVWGVVHVGWMIVEWANCNDKTGLDFDYPHCVNRYFPAETIPDFSFYLYFCSVAAELLCTIWWLWFGTELQMAATQILFSTKISGGGLVGQRLHADSMVLSHDSPHADSNQLMQDYLRKVGVHIGAALDRHGREVPEHQLSIEDRALHRIAGQQVALALVDYNSGQGKTGTGIQSFTQYLGTRIGADLRAQLRAHSSHLSNAMMLNAHGSPDQEHPLK